jgi:hypothetical protein
MEFLLYQIVARIVGIVVCVYCGRKLWRGFVERKIALTNDDIFDFVDWSKIPFDRDAAPVRYWLAMSFQFGGMLIGLVLAIVGWWQPNG